MIKLIGLYNSMVAALAGFEGEMMQDKDVYLFKERLLAIQASLMGLHATLIIDKSDKESIAKVKSAANAIKGFVKLPSEQFKSQFNYRMGQLYFKIQKCFQAIGNQLDRPGKDDF